MRVLTNKRCKHIEQDFCSVPRVMPKSWDLGAQGPCGCPGGNNSIFKHGYVAYHIEGDDE